MAKKEAKETPAAKPVIAIEFGGRLYPTFQKAEGARAEADLLTLLVPPAEAEQRFDQFNHFRDCGKREAVVSVLTNAERVHSILSRYLNAAKIEMPTNVQG